MKNKTFLTTLLLFSITINLGISILCITFFKDTINQAKKRSLDIHYFIASELTKNFYAFNSRGLDIETSLPTLFQPYNYLLENEKSGVLLYKNNNLIYSNYDHIFLQGTIGEFSQDENRHLSIKNSNGHTILSVSGNLPHPYESYNIVYVYNMTDSITSWKKTKNILYLLGVTLSCILALGLLLVLNRIFKPLLQISKNSHKIANGEYETRLIVSGHDELAEVAENFNNMAEQIQCQIAKLTATAAKKQEFIDNFAHELRTPLTAIYGYAEYMQKANLTEEDRLSSINYIMSESKRIQLMAYQLLDLANLRNDQITFQKNSVFKLFEATKQTLYNKLREKEIELDILCNTDFVWGDTCLLQSLLINITDNAIKSCTQGGHVVLRASTQLNQTILYIEDNGKGMPPDVLEHITEPFYRADRARSRKDGGAGLGLSLCRQIVENHNAKLKFDSKLGKGTKVKITFTTP